MSANMAKAIRVNADELARDNPEAAERVLQQACAMISHSKLPIPIVFSVGQSIKSRYQADGLLMLRTNHASAWPKAIAMS